MYALPFAETLLETAQKCNAFDHLTDKQTKQRKTTKQVDV